MDDYTPTSLTAAVASGKTTLIYSGGSSTAVANHVEVARYVARRVAEELANALVLPIRSDVSESPASRRSGARDEPACVRNREQGDSLRWLHRRRDHRR